MTEAPVEFIIDADGNITVGSADAAVFDQATLLDIAGTIDIRSIDSTPRYRVATTATSGGQTTVVALSLESADQLLASLRRNIIVGGLALFGVQVLAIWFIARAVAKPVTKMSDVAHRIAGGDLDAKVGPPNGSQETAALAFDLSQMLVQLRSTIAERELSAAEAHQARDDMERFMADASHELRTPLTALKGYSDLYLGGMLDPDGLDRAMRRIGSESQRLTDLVVGLLDLMKQDGGARMTEVDMADTITRVVDDVTAAYPDRTISCSPHNGTAAVVVGDAHRLHQALLNLVANACQHTPPQSTVELHLAIDQTDIEVENADQLFVAFARGDESRSRKSHDGAGLGLALVRRIATQHGGSSWVRNTPGGGATFGITLPRGTASSGDVATSGTQLRATVDPPGALGGKRRERHDAVEK